MNPQNSTIKTLNAATQLTGRQVAWPVEEHKIKGKIVAEHGKNGLVRSRFRKGIPGTALLSTVDII
jgi:ribosomal protein L35AE/L33A